MLDGNATKFKDSLRKIGDLSSSKHDTQTTGSDESLTES